MNSHIQIPKCVFREFALNNHGFYKYSVKSHKITRGYPKTTFTEENYYSETMEHILSKSVESPLNKLLTFARELPNTSLPITYNAEIADIALTYAKSLVARNPLLCESAISHSLLGQFLPKRDQHDYCVSHAMTNEKMTELFSQFDLSFIVNQTETPFVLATRGLYDFTINKTICMISPLNPYCGLFFIEKCKTIHSQGNGEKEIMFIPTEFDDVVMKINSFALARQMSDGIGYVLSHDSDILVDLTS